MSTTTQPELKERIAMATEGITKGNANKVLVKSLEMYRKQRGGGRPHAGADTGCVNGQVPMRVSFPYEIVKPSRKDTDWNKGIRSIQEQEWRDVTCSNILTRQDNDSSSLAG